MDKANEIQKKIDINADKLEHLYLLKRRTKMTYDEFEKKYGETDKQLNEERQKLKDEYIQLIRS